MPEEPYEPPVELVAACASSIFTGYVACGLDTNAAEKCVISAREICLEAHKQGRKAGVAEVSRKMELGDVMDKLYASEISCSVSSFWDGGYTVKLGHELNGFLVEGRAKNTHEAAIILDRMARTKLPQSDYALLRRNS